MKACTKIKYYLSHKTVRYYLSKPLTFLFNRALVLHLRIKKILGKDVNFSPNVSSDIPIDVVLTAVEKDYDVMVYAINSIRKNIKHPINNIFVVSPHSEKIIAICRDYGCVFVDENKVLPITKRDICYDVNGIDRSGWLFQQLLKWGIARYVEGDYFLVTDADTVFCRPQVFIWEEKIIFSINSCLAHIPYLEVYNKMFKENITASMNFVSHHSLIKKSILFDLIKKIENDSKVPWFKVILNSIDKNETSSFSEYDTYGYFVFNNYREECMLEHWFNLSLSRKKLENFDSLITKCGLKYKTVSFHSYK